MAVVYPVMIPTGHHRKKMKSKKVEHNFYTIVKPGDENFTKIGDSLAPASSLGDPLFWSIADGDVIWVHVHEFPNIFFILAKKP